MKRAKAETEHGRWNSSSEAHALRAGWRAMPESRRQRMRRQLGLKANSCQCSKGSGEQERPPGLNRAAGRKACDGV